MPVITSGVRYLAFIIPQIVALALMGVVVSQWGYYVSDISIPFVIPIIPPDRC